MRYRDKRLSSVDLYKLVQNYQSEILGSYIINIYYDGGTYYLKLRGPRKRYLVLQSQVRVNLTNSLPPQSIVNPLVTKLRRYLRNSRIEGVSQYKFDRILEISLNRGYKLICEVLPRGNIILVDNNTILIAEKYVEMRDRKIVPGEPYVYPPNSPELPLKIKGDQLRNIIISKKNAFKVFFTLGLGYKYSLELCNRLSINCESNLESVDVDIILRELRNLFKDILDSNKGYIYYYHGEPVMFSPILIGALSELEYNVLESFDEAIDMYFNLLRLRNEGNLNIISEKEKLEKILMHQENQIKALEEKIEKLRRVAAKLYENYKIIENILQIIREAKDIKKLSWDEIIDRLKIAKGKISELSLVKRIDNRGTITFDLAGDEVSMNYRETVNRYAQKIYEKIKKLESKLLGAKEKYKETMKKLSEINRTIEITLEEQNWLVREPPREWYHGFRWFYTSNGLLVVAGRDAQTNITLLKHHANLNDLIFHADIPGGAVVLLKGGKDLANDQDLMQAAIYAGAYSKAWKYGYSAVDVFMTDIDHVKFSPPSGMYLKRGSFLVLKKLREFRNVPLELAIGLFININSPYISTQIISAPVEVIEKRANVWVRLIPGKKEKSKVSREIVEFFKDYILKVLKLRISKKLLDALIKLERVVELIPGGSEIKEGGYF